MLGYPDQAQEGVKEALAQAHRLAHPFRLAWTLNFAAMFSQYCREEQLVHERAEAKILLANENGFPYWLALGSVWRGWALVGQEQMEEGITQIRQGLAAYSATGAALSQPHFLALLAERHAKGGQADEGLNVVEQALAAVNKTGERYYEAELYRLKGELTLQKEFKVEGSKFQVENPQSAFRNPQSEAEACFLKAIEIARKQQAKSLELRAAMSLARLWQQQGKQHEAHTMLSEIYNWFTEGFDTKDLQEAKALLGELQR
jgi:predicted ATPase